MARLGQTWRDEQFNEFGREVTLLKASLDNFAAATRTAISELLRDAERLEELYRIQNEL